MLLSLKRYNLENKYNTDEMGEYLYSIRFHVRLCGTHVIIT